MSATGVAASGSPVAGGASGFHARSELRCEVGTGVSDDGRMAELMRALLDPRMAWSTARRGDPRLNWWRSFVLGLLVAMFACAGAFVGIARLLSRVVETQPSGLVPLLLVVLAFFFLAAAAAYFVLIMVAAASRLMDP